METSKNFFQNPLELGLENSLSIYIWNHSGTRSKINKRLVRRAPGHFIYGILKESLSKSIGNWYGSSQFTYGNLTEFLSESFGNLSAMSTYNSYGVPFEITQQLVRRALILHMESLRKSFHPFQNH